MHMCVCTYVARISDCDFHQAPSLQEAAPVQPTKRASAAVNPLVKNMVDCHGFQIVDLDWEKVNELTCDEDAITTSEQLHQALQECIDTANNWKELFETRLYEDSAKTATVTQAGHANVSDSCLRHQANVPKYAPAVRPPDNRGASPRGRRCVKRGQDNSQDKTWQRIKTRRSGAPSTAYAYAASWESPEDETESQSSMPASHPANWKVHDFFQRIVDVKINSFGKQRYVVAEISILRTTGEGRDQPAHHDMPAQSATLQYKPNLSMIIPHKVPCKLHVWRGSHKLVAACDDVTSMNIAKKQFDNELRDTLCGDHVLAHGIDKETVETAPGQALFFLDTFVHAGAMNDSNEGEAYRFHAYIVKEHTVSVDNVTCPLEPAVYERILGDESTLRKITSAKRKRMSRS